MGYPYKKNIFKWKPKETIDFYLGNEENDNRFSLQVKTSEGLKHFDWIQNDQENNLSKYIGKIVECYMVFIIICF